MLFDTHCHLDVEQFDADREEVFSRATGAGVTQFLNPAFDLASSRRAIAMAHGHASVVAAVGIHPNDIGACDDQSLAQLRELAQTEKVVAIGEIGLDYYWNTFPHEIQLTGLRSQLELAQSVGLPIIVHCRDAYDDLLQFLEATKPTVGVLLHAFAGTTAHMQRAFDLGCMFGIGGPVTYKNGDMLRRVVDELPLDRILLETDAPYLAPHPYRGKRNEPSFLALTAERVAVLKGQTLEVIAHLSSTNALRFFGLT